MRKIIHIDMDAFYASVEQRDHPEYRGRPVAVGGSPESRGVVSAASYEARKYGIHSAMSSYKALRLCPHLIFLPHRFEVYKAVSRQIRGIFADYTDLIEPLSLDEAYLDVTENKKGIASATEIARIIKRRIWEETGLTASAGVSYNKFLAKVASDYRKPDGLFVITPAEAERFIEELPIEQFYGIGAKTAPRLKAMGIFNGRSLKSLTQEQLRSIFGKAGDFYYRLVRGQDDRPVETDWVRKSIGAENTFPKDLSDPEEMLAELKPLAQEVLDWMDRHQTYGRTLTLKVKYADFQQVTRSRTLEQSFDRLELIMEWLEKLLGNTDAKTRPVRLLGLSMSNLGPRKDANPPELADDECSRQLRLPLQFP
jgi:DNA polymerase-4